jgi:hypothetical protein
LGENLLATTGEILELEIGRLTSEGEGYFVANVLLLFGTGQLVEMNQKHVLVIVSHPVLGPRIEKSYLEIDAAVEHTLNPPIKIIYAWEITKQVTK